MTIPTPDSPESEEKVPDKYDIDEFVNKRTFWVSKVFMRGGITSTILFGAIFSIIFFLLAIVFSAITFDNLKLDTISISNITAFFTTTGKTPEEIQFIAEFYFMPIYLLIHIVMLAVIHFEMKKAFKIVPNLVNMPEKELQKRIKRVTSNIFAILLALPFILYDGFWSNQFITDPENTQPLLDLLAFISWTIEWLIFGIVVYSLFSFTLFVRHITKYYKYEENILSIVIKGKSEPLTNLGYKNAFIFGGFVFFNLVYMIVTGYWISDFVALILMFLILPIVAIFPLQMVQNKVKHEQNSMIDQMTDRFVEISMYFIGNSKNVDLESKVDIFLTSKILDELKQYKKETLKVYLRLAWVLGASLVGLLLNFKDLLLPFMEQILQLFAFGGK